jgi:hypothetical protein
VESRALILAELIILAARMASGLPRTDRTIGPGRDSNVDDLAAELGALAGQQLNAEAQVHPYRALAVALLAGLAVGASPE